MATLQRIRNRAGLLVGVIGVAMLAFILTDLLNSGTSILNRSRNEIGEINGLTVSAQEFQRRLEANISNKYGGQATEEDRNRERDVLWNNMVREQLLAEAYEATGVTVSADELDDLITGSRTGNLHNLARQLFGIQPGQEVNSAAIKQNLLSVMQNDPQNAQVYLYYENEIKKQRLKEKYDLLIKSGIQATDYEAKAYNEAQGATINGRYIFKSYSSIDDNSIEVSESDLRSAYNKQKEDYKQEANASLQFVVFNIEPSEEDMRVVREELAELMGDRVVFNKRSNKYDTLPGFKNTDADSAFVQQHSDFAFNGNYFKQGGLNPVIDDLMFDADLGYIHGPYEHDGAYHLSKLIEIAERPDSVEARHILIKPEAGLPAAQALADSLYDLIENGADFAELAKEFSQDVTASEGGDLGYFAEGQMVPAFNDACFNGKTGDLKIVTTQFGVHIIEVTDQKDFQKVVRVATVSRSIDPSSATADRVYNQASQFAAENKDLESFKASAAEGAVSLREASNLLANAYAIPGLGQAREIVRWAHDEKSEVGAVRMFDLSDQFVVAILTAKNPEGYKTLDEVKDRLRAELLKDKKAEQIIADINAKNASDLDALAQALSLEVKTMTAVRLSSPTIPGAGFEPAVVGAAFGLNQGAFSAPIQGNNGVYVLTVDSKNANANQDLASAKRTLQTRYSTRVSFEPLNALEEKAEIVDERAKIY